MSAEGASAGDRHGERARAPYHVIAIDASPAPTGAYRAVANLAEALKPDGAVTLVLPRGSRIPADEATAFAEIVYLPIVNVRKSLVSLVAYLPALLWSGWQIASLASRKRAAWLVVNDFYLMHGVVARLLGFAGTLITWVRIDPERYPAPLRRPWIALSYRWSDTIVAVSDFIVRRLPSSPKLVRIYDHVTPSADPAVSASSEAGPRTIVFVGNYITGKGQDYAIRAFSQISAEFEDARLLFFGGDMGLEKNREFRRGLEAMAKDLGLDQRIEFHGFQQNTGFAYGRGGIALNLSESESFSLTCLEASAFGLAVVAFRSGGPEEIIVDGESGFLCPLGDVAAVADALRKLLADPARARAMGLAGVRRAEARFGVQQFRSALREIMGRSREDPALPLPHLT